MILTENNFKPSALMHPAGYKRTYVANEVGHLQHRVTAYLSCGLMVVPNEDEATGYHITQELLDPVTLDAT